MHMKFFLKNCKNELLNIHVKRVLKTFKLLCSDIKKGGSLDFLMMDCRIEL